MIIESVTPVIVSPPSDTWAVVRITTDSGLIGWGEFSGHPMSNSAVGAIIRTFAPQLIGKDPRAPGQCLVPITGWRYPSYLDARMMVLALSAMDMALWDIAAQNEGVPLCRMLGGKIAPIPLYANLNRLLRGDRSLDKLITSASRAMEAGLSMVKIAPFDEVNPHMEHPDPAHGIARYRAVTGEIGPEKVPLDCHCRFTPDSFDALVEMLDGDIRHIPFIEDPVRIRWSRDLEPVYRQHSGINYASGEDCFSGGELLDLARSGMLRILNPDVKYIGGISGGRKVIPQLMEAGVEVCLHNPGGPVATAHSAHLSTLCGETVLEFAYGDQETRDALVVGREPVERGVYRLTNRPGIGIGLDEVFLEQYGAIG